MLAADRTLIAVVAVLALAGCDQLGIESPASTKARVEADGKSLLDGSLLPGPARTFGAHDRLTVDLAAILRAEWTTSLLVTHDHAEANAIILAGRDACKGATIYVTGNAEVLNPLFGTMIGKLPIAFWFSLVLAVVLWAVLRFTRMGQAMKAVGLNETGAIFSGIGNRRVKVLAFGLSGFFAGLVGVMIIAQGGAASSFGLGSDLLLPGIAAAGLIVFIFSWNEYFLATLLTSNAAKTTPPFRAQKKTSSSRASWTCSSAGAVPATSPWRSKPSRETTPSFRCPATCPA